MIAQALQHPTVQKQWGTWGSNDAKEHYFPISFSSACYQIVCAVNVNDGANMSKNRVYVSGLTNYSFFIANSGNGIRMIAIGV